MGADTSGLSKGLGEAQRKMQTFGTKMQSLGTKMKDIGGKMTMGITLPLAAAGAASFKMAADFQDAMGASDQIFKSSSETMKNWAKELPTYYGIAKGEALEYSNMMGSMLQNIGGLTEEQAAKQAQDLVKLAGDLTAMYGGETSSAVQALTGALKGNNTMLDNYGMAVNDAMIKTKAFEMGIYKGKGEMDLATKQAATLALIMEQTGAAQGQAAREAKGASGSWRTFKTEMKNLSTTIGEELLPVITPLIQSITGLVKGFGGLSPGVKKAIVALALVVAAIGPILMMIGTLAGLFASLTTIAAGVGVGLSAIILPALGIAAAIAAVIAIGVLLIKNWDKVKASGLRMWDNIKTTWHNSGVYLRHSMDIAGQGIIDKWNEIKSKILEAIAAALRFAGAVDKAAAVQLEANEAKYAHLGKALERTGGQAGRGPKGLGFGGYALGTSWHPGGLAWVGEQGPELVNLPRGAQVLNNSKSMALAGSQTVDHSGVVYHVFQTNDRQTVAKIAQEFERGNRRIPARVAAMPSMA